MWVSKYPVYKLAWFADRVLFSVLAGTSRGLNVTFQFRFSCDFACQRRAALKRTIFPPICVWKSTGSHVTCRWGGLFSATDEEWPAVGWIVIADLLWIVIVPSRVTFLQPKMVSSPNGPVGPSTLPHWSDCPLQFPTPLWCLGLLRLEG